MTTYALVDNQDQLIRTQDFDGAAPELATAKGLRWVPWQDAPMPTTTVFESATADGVHIVGGALTTKWVVSELSEQQKATKLAQLKAARNQQINEDREAANFGTFTHNGQPVSCDRLSRSDIDGMANQIGLLGDFPQGWPGYWKCADNTYLEMTTIAQFKAMYASMIGQGLYNFGVSQTRKAALAAATTPEEVAAV